jgi:hypothetical protein
MARKRPKLTRSERDQIRQIAKDEAVRIVTEGSRLGASPFLLSPVTRPFAAPIAKGIPVAANILLKSGALDGFIDAKVNELVAKRGIVVPDLDKKSRQEILFDLAEAGIDVLADPEIQKELDNLDRALQTEGTRLPGREVIRRSGQFDLQNLLPRFEQTAKRSRKTTKTDKNMSKALAQANKDLRTKKGKLRKGKTQSDVMRRAHMLRKKMR